MIRRIASSVLVAGLVAASAVGLSGSAGAADVSDTNEAQIFTATNDWRAANELVKLKSSSCLDTYAEAWAKHIAKQKKLTHRSTSSLKSILKKCKSTSIGENLAYGQPDGTAAVAAWRNSPGHNRNMLGKSYRWTASAAYLKDGTWWYVQLVAK